MDTFLREVKRVAVVAVVVVSLSWNFLSSDPDSGYLVCSISLTSLFTEATRGRELLD
eukprot:m.70176 g.70176  ORF g.70176 m.70176 type:complete len:57 (-) comp18481_c0_seq1:978-1148(-)